MERFVFLILLTVAGAQESQLEGPRNTLSVAGSNVALKCSTPSRNCSGTEWLKYSAGSPMTIVNHQGVISKAFKDRHSVDVSCQLVIKNVELTDAGRFICRTLISSNSVEKSIFLIILETQPKCTINASLNETEEGDGIPLTCEVTYCGTNRASMLWKDVANTSAAVEIETQSKCRPTTIAPQKETAEGEGTNNETNRTTVVRKRVTNAPVVEKIGKTITRSSFVVASAPEVPSFTCITSFAVETKETDGKEVKGLATNIPVVTCETPSIRVLYSVRNVTLSPSRAFYTSGDVIYCTAKGHPSPTFKWQEMENDGTWMDIQNQNGSEFTMTSVSSKWYRCVAMNVVRSKSYNATSQEFLVNNTDSDYYGSLTATTIKSVAVGAAVGFLFLIILLIICFCERVCPGYKCCNSGNKSKDKIRKEQPLTENPDPCIYSVVNKRQAAHPKAKPSEPSKQGAPPQAIARTGNKKAGHTNTFQYEEVTYADLAMEVGPRKVVPKYKPEQQETLYAAVGAA